MPPNNTPMFVKQNGATGFVLSANGLQQLNTNNANFPQRNVPFSNGTLQQQLKDEPPIKRNNFKSVIRLALAVQNYCATVISV